VIRSFLAYAFLTSVSFALVVVFSMMWVMDAVKVVEPNLPIRTIELALSVALTGLGIERLCHWVKTWRKGGSQSASRHD